MRILECLPPSQYKYVFQSILPNHPRCNFFISYNLKENPNRLVGSTRSSIEILHSIKTITRLESEILQIRSLLWALEAGSLLVCNTQHMMAEPLTLPSPKDPSTTSPTACRLCLFFLRWPFVRILVLLLVLVACRLQNPAIQTNGVEPWMLCDANGRFSQSFCLNSFIVFGYDAVNFSTTNELYNSI